MFIPHVSVMLRDMSPHEPHISHMYRLMWVACGTLDIHTCLQDLTRVSHVKNLYHMWINVRTWNRNVLMSNADGWF